MPIHHMRLVLLLFLLSSAGCVGKSPIDGVRLDVKTTKRNVLEREPIVLVARLQNSTGHRYVLSEPAVRF